MKLTNFIVKYNWLLFLLYAQCTIATSFPDGINSLEHFSPDFLDESEDETARIIGGTDAEEGEFPYAVALYYDGSYVCTGSLISPESVLTSAHCVVIDHVLQPANLFSGVFGAVNRSSDSGKMVTFSNVSVHPEYTEETYANDIAILTMEQQLQSSTIKPICIDGQSNIASRCRHAIIMGWGKTSTDPDSTSDLPDNLQHARVKVLSHILCMLRYPLMISEKQMCADGFGRGICFGDSGGPMVDEQNTVQIALASYVAENPGCGSFILSPGVMTRTSSYVEWIRSIAGENVCVI